MQAPVILEQNGGVATVVLNRPDCLNALDLNMVGAFKEHLQRLATARDISAVIIAGRGKAFCAGGDLAWASGFDGGLGQALHVLAGEFHHAILEIREMEKPVIAAIAGVAAGGGFSLALACDFRVMSRTATLRQAYTGVGLSMDGGASFTLPRLVGEARALEIAAFDEPIDADRALAAGLVTEIAEGDVVAAARALAGRLSTRSLASIAASKRLINGSFQTALATQLGREREAIVACAASAEGREGVSAFTAKRRPDFAAARASDRA